MAEHIPSPWELKDPLQVMKEKFNLAVQAIIDLQSDTEGVNSETLNQLEQIQNTFNAELNQIKFDLSNKIDSVDKSDLNLDKVDNTSDLDKPVSTATRQAIAEATDGMITSEETGAEFDSTGLSDPVVSDHIKQYIEDRVAELLIAYNNGTYNPEYNIASNNRLGVVKASNQIQINQDTGEMYSSDLTVTMATVTNLNTQLTAITESLESNNTATSKLVNDVGNVSGLATSTKTSIVAAINELVRKVNDLDS